MKTRLIIITFFLLIQNGFSQEITGTWYGTLEVQTQKIPVVFHIEKVSEGFKSTMDSPMQGAMGFAVKTTQFQNQELTLEAPNLGITYKGKLVDKEVQGTFMQGGMTLPLTLGRESSIPELKRPQTPKAPFSYNSNDITFKNDVEGNLLAGTISTPKDFNKKSPILVMITGSGAQNRDEEIFEHKPFLVIADDLAKKGIATLRIDDRGVQGSDKGKSGATSADFATDINSAVNYLVQNGYKNIGLIGHSEGGMIAPMVANMNKNVKFLVLLAAPGIPTRELLVLQTNEIGRVSGATESELKSNDEFNTKLYNFVNDYKGNDLKTDVYTMLVDQLKKLPADQISPEQIAETAQNEANQVSNPWFQYFIKFNPDDYLSKVKIPVLALNGSLDLQVSAVENLNGIKKSLTKAGNKHFEIVKIDGLNHLFQTTETGNPAEYAKIEETFSPKALEKISSWVLKLK